MANFSAVTATLPPLIGHRGACGHAPENTLASMRRAAALGARWIEFDARLTRDKQIVVFHDDTLERTTNGQGRVAETELAAIQALDAGIWYGEAFRGERVPTLEQTLAVLAEQSLGANVEIKCEPEQEAESGRIIAERLRYEWPASLPPPLISSFDPAVLAAARKSAPDITLALLVKEIPADWRERLVALDCTALHCHQQWLTHELALAITDAGVPLRCYTVNDCERAEILFGWGVQSIFTDYPDRFLLR